MTESLRLLVIEDSEDDALLILRQLQRGGYEIFHKRVDTAAGLMVALNNYVWDIVIADYAMPGFTGIAALEIFKQKAIDIPFIIVSGSIGEEIAVNAMKAGAHDYVMKEKLARLLPAVARELREAENRRIRKRTEKVQKAIYEISESTSLAENLQALYPQIHKIFAELMPARNFYIALYDPDTHLLNFPYYVDEYDQPPIPLPLQNGLTEYVLRTGKPLLASPEVQQALEQSGEVTPTGTRAVDWMGVPLRVKETIIGVLAVQSYTQGIRFGADEVNILGFVSTQVAMAISRKKAEEALRESEERFRKMADNIQDGITIIEDGKAVYINDRACQIFGYPHNELLKTSHFDLAAPDEQQRLRHLLDETQDGSASPKSLEFWIVCKDGSRRYIQNRYSESIEAGSSIRYIVTTDRTEQQRAEEQLQRQFQRLSASRTIDMAITASLDLRVTLDVLLDQATYQLGVDAADILLFDPNTQILGYMAGRGFRSIAITHTHLRLGEGLAGRAALERRIITVPDLPHAVEFLRTRLLGGEGFVSYISIPLIAKGQVKGVLELFQRTSIPVEPDWLDFVETMAGQAAIAIDNYHLFDNLQRSNTELALAYDATIQGWSSAIDLRERGTRGHAEHVAEITLRLAADMGMNKETLLHIRRGALLHDIGNMGIPDSILWKKGPLTEEEMAVIRQHPQYAYELLSPILHLRSALDIPYCHHEKWDGTGYPRGLKGEQIPLAARIFAVVDAWDALQSDRPYRPAMSAEQARQYILEQSDKQFDPQVVKLFLQLLNQQAL